MNARFPGPATSRISCPAAVLVAVAMLATGVLVGSVFVAAPGYASSSTDLSVTLTNKVDAKPGRRVAYRVVLRNKGPATASRVRIDFTTSVALRSITYRISSGWCYHAPREATCVFGRIGAGTTATATISGVMPKKLKNGTPVTNRVTVASSTRLVNRVDDVATDNYRMGIPRTVPTAVPSPVPSGGDKLAAITSAASKVLGYSRKAVAITFATLGAAIAWFAIGLTLRRRTRARRATINID